MFIENIGNNYTIDTNEHQNINEEKLIELFNRVVNYIKAIFMNKILSGRYSFILLILFGTLANMSIQLSWMAVYSQSNQISDNLFLFRIITGSLAFSLMLITLRSITRKLIKYLPFSRNLLEKYRKYDTITYSVSLLFLLQAIGIRIISIPMLYVLGISFFASQFLLILILLKKYPDENNFFITLPWLSFLFLISGFAAIMYQIVWYRTLYAAYGINIESVTIIVSVFMLGLGVGSLAGGILSKYFPSKLPFLFVLCEITIGLFGIVSISLIKWISVGTMLGSHFSLSLTIYSILCIPTMAMGATLPILVTYLHKFYKNVGKSVGILYCINTLGSALAALITVDVLFVFFGLQTTVLMAALCNFFVAGLVYLYTKQLTKKRISVKDSALTQRSAKVRTPTVAYPIPLFLAILIAATIGYISMSQEILWIRVVDFACHGLPFVFGHVLGFVLLGIASGAYIAKWLCEKKNINPQKLIVCTLTAAAIVYYFSIPLFTQVMTIFPIVGLLFSYLLICIIASLFGIIFPVLCHYTIISTTSVGFLLSLVYLSNIAGSTAGPLVTGFLLLDKFSLEQNILFICILILVFSGTILFFTSSTIKGKAATFFGFSIMILLIFFSHNPLYTDLIYKLSFNKSYQKHNPLKYIVQNRSGIITVEEGKTSSDIIYGGGIYDGRFNVDPVQNSNGIRRSYMMAAFHKNPEAVLEIGLSSGSWAWVIASHKAVKNLTIIEINPGYLQIIKQYSQQAEILENPKVTIQIDDGRKWLKQNNDKKFDFIVMNTTFHYKNFATNLLSVEFLALCKSHLKQGGVIYFNTTRSDEAFYTAAEVFENVTKYSSFVAASDSSFDMTKEEKQENFLKFFNNGQSIFDPDNTKLQQVLNKLIQADISDRASTFPTETDRNIITDDNMLTEFKISSSPVAQYYKWLDPEIKWGNLYEKITNYKKIL